MALTKKQRRSARKLRQQRPTVIPGTNVVVDEAQRKAWFHRITAAMKTHNVIPSDAHAFCDIAGVPD